MSHLTLEQRYKIESYLSLGKSYKIIAEYIDRDKSVVSREIKRNSDLRNKVYKAKLAQKKAEERHKNKAKRCFLTDQVKEHIQNKLKSKYSPEQIVGRAKKEGVFMVSVECIYQYIWRDKKQKGNLYKYLRTKGKRYKKRAHSKDNRGVIVNRIDIDKRPSVVDKKERLGDLEIDLVIGKDHKGALVTINDRATGILFMGKIARKQAELVVSKTIELLKDWRPFLKTITSDNGKEFANHQVISEKLNIDYYFAKPYHSWERGANENLNGLVRQFFPKKTNFEHITQEQINTAINNLNNRPRKRFGYKTPNEILAEKLDNFESVAFIS